MGLFDDIKDKAGELKDKAEELIQGKGDQVGDAVDTTGDFVDDKTGGRFSENVDTVQEKAKEVSDDLDHTN